VPSIIIAIILFAILGFNADATADALKIQELSDELVKNFNISPVMLVPLFVLMAMAVKKVPAFPTVFIGALLGAIWALIFQPEMVAKMVLIADPSQELHTALGTLKVLWSTLHGGFSIDTGHAELDKLLSGGGMSKMMNTVWLIMSAMVFGSVLEHTGLLARFVQVILAKVHSTGSLVASTIGTCVATNILAADQYMAIVMPGRMYKDEYEKRGLAPVNLSRTLEDGGTITSALIPWNTCGAYMHGVLGISPLEYMFYAFFNLINPLLAIIYAYCGIKILKLTPPETLFSPAVANTSTDNRQ
jgi:NhaC family Na+:H+ antiporter